MTNCTCVPSPRIKVKKGLHVMAARLAQPTLWTAKLERFKGSKHHTTLIICHRVGPVEPNSRWVLSFHEGRDGPRVQVGRFMGLEGRRLPRGPLYSHVVRHKSSQSPSRKQHKTDIFPSLSYYLSIFWHMPGTVSVSLIPGDINLSWSPSHNPHSHYPISHSHYMCSFFQGVNISPKAQLQFLNTYELLIHVLCLGQGLGLCSLCLNSSSDTLWINILGKPVKPTSPIPTPASVSSPVKWT